MEVGLLGAIHDEEYNDYAHYVSIWDTDDDLFEIWDELKDLETAGFILFSLLLAQILISLIAVL